MCLVVVVVFAKSPCHRAAACWRAPVAKPSFILRLAYPVAGGPAGGAGHQGIADARAETASSQASAPTIRWEVRRERRRARQTRQKRTHHAHSRIRTHAQIHASRGKNIHGAGDDTCDAARGK